MGEKETKMKIENTEKEQKGLSKRIESESGILRCCPFIISLSSIAIHNNIAIVIFPESNVFDIFLKSVC